MMMMMMVMMSYLKLLLVPKMISDVDKIMVINSNRYLLQCSYLRSDNGVCLMCVVSWRVTEGATVGYSC